MAFERLKGKEAFKQAYLDMLDKTYSKPAAECTDWERYEALVYLINKDADEVRNATKKRQVANREKPYGKIPETIQNSCTAFRIRRRRNFTDRLVACDIVFFRFGPDGFTVYSDDIRRLIYLRTQFGDDCSVYGNMAAGNKLFSIPSRSDAAGSKIFLKPH